MIDLKLVSYMQEELRHTPLYFRRYMYDNFKIGKHIFEVSGRKKTKKQLENAPHGFLILL